jgi:hypothetical protein
VHPRETCCFNRIEFQWGKGEVYLRKRWRGSVNLLRLGSFVYSNVSGHPRIQMYTNRSNRSIDSNLLYLLPVSKAYTGGCLNSFNVWRHEALSKAHSEMQLSQSRTTSTPQGIIVQRVKFPMRRKIRFTAQYELSSETDCQEYVKFWYLSKKWKTAGYNIGEDIIFLFNECGYRELSRG